MQDLNIAIIQTELYWEDVDSNLKHFTNKLSLITSADIIILPEMFTTGFSINAAALAKQNFERTIEWMQSEASKKKAALVGSLMTEVDGKYFNTMAFCTPDKNVVFYNKKHLFTHSGEPDYYTAGSDKIVITYKGWRILPIICYDLRFPIFCRNTHQYDMLLCVANWPDKRSYAWQQLLIARAIENQYYVAACNRIGSDNNNLLYSGYSGIVDYNGNAQLIQNTDTILYHTLSYSAMHDQRKTFNVLNDKDNFNFESINIIE